MTTWTNTPEQSTPWANTSTRFNNSVYGNTFNYTGLNFNQTGATFNRSFAQSESNVLYTAQTAINTAWRAET